MKQLPIQLRKKAKTPAQRKVRMSTLIHKAFEAGWLHSAAQAGILWRNVPYKTRETYYTIVCRGNDSAHEMIAQTNLQYCGPRSRVFKKLSI